jgi:hypothetical protein
MSTRILSPLGALCHICIPIMRYCRVGGTPWRLFHLWLTETRYWFGRFTIGMSAFTGDLVRHLDCRRLKFAVWRNSQIPSTRVAELISAILVICELWLLHVENVFLSSIHWAMILSFFRELRLRWLTMQILWTRWRILSAEIMKNFHFELIIHFPSIKRFANRLRHHHQSERSWRVCHGFLLEGFYQDQTKDC